VRHGCAPRPSRSSSSSPEGVGDSQPDISCAEPSEPYTSEDFAALLGGVHPRGLVHGAAGHRHPDAVGGVGRGDRHRPGLAWYPGGVSWRTCCWPRSQPSPAPCARLLPGRDPGFRVVETLAWPASVPRPGTYRPRAIWPAWVFGSGCELPTFLRATVSLNTMIGRTSRSLIYLFGKGERMVNPAKSHRVQLRNVPRENVTESCPRRGQLRSGRAELIGISGAGRVANRR
jgi:hypothetical protein